jgi:serine protease inhibitor
VLPVLLAISKISAQCLMGNDVPSVMDPTSRTLLTDARYAFALDSLKKTALIESRDNIFFSPHSLHHALTLAYFGARGTTAESFKKALRIPDQLSKVDMQRYYAFERSLNEMRSEVSNYSGAIAQLPGDLFRCRQVCQGKSRVIYRHIDEDKCPVLGSPRSEKPDPEYTNP